LARECAKVDVRPIWDISCGDRFVCVASLEEEGSPFLDFGRVLRDLHVGEEVVCTHRVIAVLEKLTVILTADKAHMRHRVDEFFRRGENALLNKPCPKLF